MGKTSVDVNADGTVTTITTDTDIRTIVYSGTRTAFKCKNSRIRNSTNNYGTNMVVRFTNNNSSIRVIYLSEFKSIDTDGFIK